MSEEETVTTTEEVDVEETPEVKEATSENDDVESEATDEPEAEKPKPTKEQRKIAELSYKTREQNRQIERLLKAVETQSQAISKPQEAKAPKIEDYDTIDEYVDAKLDFRMSASKPEKASEPEQEPMDTSELFSNGSDKYEDFNEVVGAENIKITPIMANAILEIDDPDIQVDVAYALGLDTKEAIRISKLSPIRQIAAIAKLEDKLANKAKPQKRASAAPEPIKPVSGSKTTNDEIQPGESYESFLKKRNKQLGRG